MSFSYDSTRLEDEINQIRLHLGDTDEDEPLLQDEEIRLMQSSSSSFRRRVAACCRLICAKVARDVDYRLSLLSEDASEVYERYKDMAERYEVMGSSNYPWAGSILESFKDSTEKDNSLVKPKFKKGQMDNE